MKIAMIGQKGIATRAGGAEVHVEQLGERLASSGHEIYVYSRSQYTDKNIKIYKGMNNISLPSVNSKHLDSITNTFLASIHSCLRNRDVYHYHSIGPSSLCFIPKLLRKRVVCTVHGLDWERQKWGKLAKMYLRFGERMAAKLANEIVVVSENLKVYFKNKYKRDVVFIPNGINKEQIYKPDIIYKKYGLVRDEYILFLARLVPEKGAHYLIEAYNKIKTDKKLIIAGGSSHSSKYVEKIKSMSKGNGNIILTGFVEGNELKELYSNAYIYVLPSEIEGMPISLLEAMSFGQTAIVSDIKENTDVINQYGWKFESKNPESLAEILTYVVQNPLMVTENRIKAQNYVLQQFNWDRISNQLEEIYIRVCKSS